MTCAVGIVAWGFEDPVRECTVTVKPPRHIEVLATAAMVALGQFARIWSLASSNRKTHDPIYVLFFVIVAVLLGLAVFPLLFSSYMAAHHLEIIGTIAVSNLVIDGMVRIQGKGAEG